MGYLVCPLCCGRSFSNRKSLKTHILTAETNICCPDCSQRFSTVVELADHLDLETCEQLAFVIRVNNTPDPNGKLEAYGRSVLYEKSSSDKPSKLSSHAVEKSHNHGSLSLSIKKEKVFNIQQDDEEDETNPLDTSRNFGQDLSSSLSNSHDMEAIKKWEQEVPDEFADHYCNSCDCSIHGVAEHINRFHSDETVILQNAEADEDADAEFTVEDVDDTISDPCHPPTSENTDKGSAHDVNGHYLGNTQAAISNHESVAPDNRKEGHPLYTDEESVGLYDIDNTTDDSPWSATTIDMVKDITSTSVTQSVLPSSIKVLSDKGKRRPPKLFSTRKQFRLVYDDTRKCHVKRIVETESLQGKVKESDIPVIDLSESKEVLTKQKIKKRLLIGNDVVSPKKKPKPVLKQNNAESCISVPVVKVPPKLKKPTLIQAHITQLLRSKAIDTLKQSLPESSSNVASNEDVLQQLFTAANEYLGSSGSSKVLNNGERVCSSSPSDSPLKISEENRSIILKFESDNSNPLSKNTIPVFVCNVCSVEFTNPHDFAAHKCKIPKPVLPTLCEICGVKCKTHSDLQLHLETHDPTFKTKKLFQKQIRKLLSEPATCDICKTEFTSARGLKGHQRMHRPDNIKKIAEMNNKIEYRCEICNDVCYSKRTFGIHSKIHFNNQQETLPTRRQHPRLGSFHSSRKLDLLTCKLCKESFSSNLDLKLHWQIHFSVMGVKLPDVTAEETLGQIEADEALFTCHLCGEKLAESLRLAHEKTHTGEMPFVCKDCNHPFLSETDLNFHMNVHNTKVELECVTCKTKFIDAALLKIHMKSHAGADHPYPCGFCGRYFSRPHEKVKHERVHTGEKPYECTTCGMRFRVSHLLRVHERIHTGIRPYSCEHCGKTFRASSNHMRHVRIHSNIRAYSCPYCPKQFKTGVQLASHKKSHTKPYTCPQCGRHFAAIYALRAHVNTHSKSTLKHTCNICGASYGRSYALNDHLKTHEKDISQEDNGGECENAVKDISQEDNGGECENEIDVYNS